MSRTLEPRTAGPIANAAEAACARALEIAADAGVEIVELEGLEALTTASQLFDGLWGTGPGDSYLSPSLLRALCHAGNYGAGAFADGRMVGAVMGFLGQDGDGTYLHSHILGVSSGHRGSNVGFALKQHQRAWAMHLGLAKVTWTFDPLVRRNAYFNLQKLGAAASSYLVNFYGRMDDDINGTDESDRLMIELTPADPRVEQAANGGVHEPATDPDATVALGMSGEVASAAWGERVLCATPPDIVDLRRRDPQAAVGWRRALRDTLGAAMSDGYTVSGFSRSGWYVLERA